MNNGKRCDESIVLFPQYEELSKEVQNLRAELSALVQERDALMLVECRRIETAYLLAFGELEYKLYELQCAILRLKRKIDLIQARKNRQDEVVAEAIESELDYEFSEYQAKLNEYIDDMEAAAERSKRDAPSDGETAAELKKLYRSIVKALHPDLNPDVSDAQIKLFHDAVQAYENGDLESIRVIAAMVTAPTPFANNVDGIKLLMKEKERLTSLLQSIKADIERIKGMYPYTLKEIVQDEERTAARKAELEEIIRQWSDTLKLYEAKVAEMVR